MPALPPPVECAWDRLRPDPAGMVLGSVFFVLALTPSLIPRDILFQGVACGLCAATGYLVGVWLSGDWRPWGGGVPRHRDLPIPLHPQP